MTEIFSFHLEKNKTKKQNKKPYNPCYLPWWEFKGAECIAKLGCAMECFVVLQRGKDSPGLYFLQNSESLHFPRGLKLFVYFSTCTFVLGLFL